jgi:hypothetical protein
MRENFKLKCKKFLYSAVPFATFALVLSSLPFLLLHLFAGYCWIGSLDCSIRIAIQLVDWIVIDNPKSKSDFGFGLSIQFLHFNPNPKAITFLIKKLKIHGQSCSGNKAKQFLIIHWQLKSWLIKKYVSWEFQF